MRKIYILIKHFNNIDDDYVAILKISSSLEELLKHLSKELKTINDDYFFIENLITYKKLSNINNEHLIEYIIEENYI